MDAYSISCTSPSSRNSSRIYQDLRACRRNSTSLVAMGVEPPAENMVEKEPINHRVQNPSKPPHIGIVGAGFAGLRCADVLLQHGFQVTILEGRDRIGGRVHQITLPNTSYLVDTGANWIHGTEHNPILELAHETQTATQSWDDDSGLFDENGRAVGVGEAAELGKITWGIIVAAFKYSNMNTKTIPKETSLYDWFVERVKESVPDDEEGWEEKRRKILQMSELWGGFVGAPVQKQSLKFFWLEESIDGGNLFNAGTYQKILARVGKAAVDNDIIRFSTQALKVRSDSEANRGVTVTTNKGENLHFDDVVMTTPLGWLKRNQGSFSPSLPPKISQAVHSLGYGSLEKIYISFPTAFWISPSSASNSATGFTQWLAPTYDPLNPSHWNMEIVELASLPSPHAHPTLLFYIFGPQSRKLTSWLASNEKSKHHDHLVDLFRPYYSLLPGYSPGSCIPTSTHATSHLLDSLAGNGSYSYFPTGVETADKDIEELRFGCPERGLWFAGEHTAPFVALGTVTGAYWSGEAVAKRIAQAWGMGKLSSGHVAGQEADSDLDAKVAAEIVGEGTATRRYSVGDV